jgi:hypothetical protein
MVQKRKKKVYKFVKKWIDTWNLDGPGFLDSNNVGF